MNKPLDHETIARAMKKAAWIAKHGTREQRSGRFIAPKRGVPPARADVDQKRRS